jgi:hypothetical protein
MWREVECRVRVGILHQVDLQMSVVNSLLKTPEIPVSLFL